LIGLLLFLGTVGKSAQWPLHVWLPDAMEGPTPVSAMIHAAAMVSAGVYMVIRMFPLLSAGWVEGGALDPDIDGDGLHRFFHCSVRCNHCAGTKGYQAGAGILYYFTARLYDCRLGIGAYVAAAFHLVTHAFFKALLFLGSGSVIHGMEHGVLHTGKHVDPQNMFNMGGLKSKMPITFWTFLIGGLALSGFPLFSAGFWSKDEILADAFGHQHFAVFLVLAVSALITAFYTMRQITLTFLGEPRTDAARNAQETGWTMTVPLIILAFFAVTAGWVGIPEYFPLIGGLLPSWFNHFVGETLLEPIHAVDFNAVPL
jgi:NADH-quinone oxidoreductase subunit L